MNKNLKKQSLTALLAIYAVFAQNAVAAPRQMENLSRGLVVSNVGEGVLVSWRLLGTDNPATEFNLYRDGKKIASIEGSAGTNYMDADGKVTSKYEVAAVVNGKEDVKSGVSVVLDKTVAANGLSVPYKTIKLDVPKNQTMPDGEICSYTPNDASAADLDGDGEYEIILKWDPSNAHDNSQPGYTGTVFIDAYKLDGTRLWRIDLGKNIRAGAHYTQFQVYDYDGDGMAEMIVKTADGTIDGTGKAIGDKSKDYRSAGGTIIEGPEYLTVFRGVDGAAITTVDYVPNRHVRNFSKNCVEGNWCDDWGNRSERYIAATAYLDGVHPSAIFIRGYYSASYVVAWDFDGKNLKQRWFHKSEKPGQGLYEQGNHNITTGDIDGDGKDEIVFGAASLNSDGTLRYSTGFGHGDAGHLSDMDPDRPGLEFFGVQEHKNAPYTDNLRDKDGKVIWGTPQPNPGVDNGRGMAADIDSTNRGFEMWSGKSGGVHNVKGEFLYMPSVSTNFRIYFDGDYLDELLDGAYVSRFHSATKASAVYFDGNKALGLAGCNGTKNTPTLVADLFGDWREEMVLRKGDDPSVLYILSTPVTSPHRVYTLMHDAVYRTAIAWQNTAYNQPPHLGYYLPDAVKKLTQPDIYVVGDGAVSPPEDDNIPVEKEGSSQLDASTLVEGKGWTEKTNEGYLVNGYYNFDNSMSSYGIWEIFSPKEAKTTFTIRYTNGGAVNRDMALNVNGKSLGTVAFESTSSSWNAYKEATVEVALVAGKNTIKFVSMTSDGGPNMDVFTFGMDGIEIYSGQKVPDPESSGVFTLPNGFAGTSAYNPSSGILRTNLSGNAEVLVFDLRGNLVGSIYKSVSAGINEVPIERDMLPRGNYIVKVNVNGKSVAQGLFSLKK